MKWSRWGLKGRIGPTGEVRTMKGRSQSRSAREGGRSEPSCWVAEEATSGPLSEIRGEKEEK